MNNIFEKDLSHFQLRLSLFYARLCFNPWRSKILYLGDHHFLPHMKEDKHLFFGSTQDVHYADHLWNLHLSTYDEIPFSDQSLDVILCHFDQKLCSESFLNECYRILKPEGKIIWTINNFYSPYYFMGHAPRYSITQARQILERHDFDILKEQGHSYISQWQNRILRKICLLLERRLKKVLPFFANKVSFVSIKKTTHYRPLPLYLQISQKIFCEREVSPNLE
jgi:SAM-dependent methyltransferase